MQQGTGKNRHKKISVSDQLSWAGDNETLPQKTTGGMIWSFLAHGVNKGLTLVTIAILSRILIKSDFGILAIATMTLSYLAIFKDLGLGAALIQRQDNVDRAASTVFFLNCIFGIILSLLTFLISPFIAAYFGEKGITSILQCLGITFFINSLGSVHLVLLKKRMDFRKKLIPDIGIALTKGVVSIGLACTGFGIWSLVIGQIAGSLVGLCLVWWVMPWRPSLLMDTSMARSLMNFGLIIMGTETLYVISSNLSLIIVGKVFGMTLLGTFSLAYRLPEVLITGNLWLIAGVLFPMFSLLQTQPDKLSQGFLASIRYVAIFSTPICFGLIVAADPLVRVLYGMQWLDVIPILQILAACAWVQSIGYHAGDVYKALGRPTIVFSLCAFSIPVEIVSLLVGAQFGLVGISLGLLFAMVIQCGINLFVAILLVRVSPGEILGAATPALLSGIVLVLIAVPIHLLTVGINPLVELVSLILCCGAGFMLTIWLTDKHHLLLVYDLVIKSRHSRATT